ncbi:hypothetical protein C0J52_26873 [Blattella germanica]|nr:hypothetical protein C0J52_26873 [Blattella germanica]
MAALPNARGWCVLEYARTDSVVAVRRAFRRQFGRPAPSETSIRRWYEQLRDRGCICHQGKGRAGRPSVNEETIERYICRVIIVHTTFGLMSQNCRLNARRTATTLSVRAYSSTHQPRAFGKAAIFCNNNVHKKKMKNQMHNTNFKLPFFKWW